MKYSIRRAMLTVILFIVSCNAFTLRTVPENQNVTKREINPHKLFPDWVPFKNKHGEDLGEFTQVDTKHKAKKRLALPQNFILKSVADSENDDYFDKGLGESDDSYDNKDWSDLNRQAHNHAVGSHVTNTTDIEGIVQALSQPRRASSNTNKKIRVEADNDDEKVVVIVDSQKQKFENEDENLPPRREDSEKNDEDRTSEDNTSEKISSEDSRKSKKVTRRDDSDDMDYDDLVADRAKNTQAEEERKENEVRKAQILDSVDQLKMRHAEEQRMLSEKLKEEEIYKEEFERNKMNSRDPGDKYASRLHNSKTDYDDYVEREASIEDKYKIKPLKRRTTSTTTTQRTTTDTRRRKEKKLNKKLDSGKLSVFKNPRAYMILDEDESTESTTTTAATEPTPIIQKFSSKLPATPTDTDENVRISLVPEDNQGKEGEPTLFFPKKRKNKRRRKFRATTASPDSSAAESIPDEASDNYLTSPMNTNFSNTKSKSSPESPSAAGSTSTEVDATSALTLPSAHETGPSAHTGSAAYQVVEDKATTAVDADVASSDHNKGHPPKHHNWQYQHGGEREHHSMHDDHHEEHGKKAYEGVHKDTKTAKGHHDSEDHLGEYHDHGGIDKHHHDEKNHYGSHNHEEHGKKHAKYEESGKHSKGHSTKGSHDIHKKDEYEKKVEFFEEEGDSAEEEKHGGHSQDREHKSGGFFKKGNLAADYHGRSKGDKGHFAETGHGNTHKGHKSAAGHDGHNKHGRVQAHQGGSQAGKKWIYHHGNPAKNGNLVRIDRRTDGYQHGPNYFG